MLFLFNCTLSCQYKRAQLYMIARHCHEESDKGEGVEVLKYEPCVDPVHGVGHYTEKRIHLYKWATRDACIKQSV